MLPEHKSHITRPIKRALLGPTFYSQVSYMLQDTGRTGGAQVFKACMVPKPSSYLFLEVVELYYLRFSARIS